MSGPPRICPECGSDTYFARNFERVRDKVTALEVEIRRMAAQHGVERANWKLAEIERANARATAQAKVERQRKVINRLERRLRDRGQQPHEGVEVGT